MKMKPIIFSTAMTKAILEGRKKQTRRAIKPQPKLVNTKDEYANMSAWEWKGKKWLLDLIFEKSGIEEYAPCKPGDILYVKETWEKLECDTCDECFRYGHEDDWQKQGYCFVYRSTNNIYGDAKWKSPLFMPKEAARLFLRVTDVKVERLQEIAADDCISEGIAIEWSDELPKPSYHSLAYYERRVKPAFIKAFAKVWNSINAKKQGFLWKDNPYVWVINFARELQHGKLCNNCLYRMAAENGSETNKLDMDRKIDRRQGINE